MIFVDHSNLFRTLLHRPESRGVATENLLTDAHYREIQKRLCRGCAPSTHRLNGKAAWTFVYIPDQGGIRDPYREDLIRQVRRIDGVFQRGGLVDWDSPTTCRARVRSSKHGGWRDCDYQSKIMVEKMIDVGMATDMVRFACKNLYDLAFVVSQDRDFIPAIRAVQEEGKKVIHAFIRRSALSKTCGQFCDIAPLFR